jgi:hypothetical protein
MEKSDPFWMRALLIMVPAVIAPLLAWLTSLRATSRRSSELDFLLRRIELVDRVQKAQGEAGAPNRSALDAELQDILADLTNLRVGPTRPHPSDTIANPHSGWRSWFLAYKQLSRKGTAYKALFYGFIGFVTLGAIGLLASGLDTGPSAPSASDQVLFGVVGVAVYLAIGLAFRYAAIREYHRSTEKRSTQIPTRDDHIAKTW